MNAYELADEAKRQVELIYLVTDESIAKQLATMLDNYAKMLRQQADRIAELERLVSDMIYEKSSGVYDRPQIKELSDGEIVRISKTCDLNHVLGLIDFARAILKKASEK